MFKKLIKNILRHFGIAVKPTFKLPLINKNKIISYSIGNIKLQIERSHVLPFITKFYPECNRNLPRLTVFLKKHFGNLVVVDIGANIGDTVAFIKNEIDVPILCIEGNQKYFNLLEKNINQFNNVYAFNKYLGEKNEVVSFKIDTLKGTSSLRIEKDSTKKKDIYIETLDNFIKSQPFDDYNINIIKIDTDGFDMKILRGGLNHLKKVKPVLFFEYDPEMLMTMNEKGLETLHLLKELGYGNILFYDSFGRFIHSQSLSNFCGIEQMHNYLIGRKAPFDYYDLCVFHNDYDNMSNEFIKSEMEYSLLA